MKRLFLAVKYYLKGEAWERAWHYAGVVVNEWNFRKSRRTYRTLNKETE